MAVRVMGGGDVFWNGKAIQVPSNIARQISIRAANLIKESAPRGPNNSRLKVRPTGAPGQIGVYFPPEARHLMYLDQGIRPRAMTELQGKTIPIRTPGGIIFRRAKNVGANILTRDENGNTLNYKLAWTYPGVQPMNFIQPAIKQAIEEWTGQMDDHDMMRMLQNMSGPIAKFFGNFKTQGTH